MLPRSAVGLISPIGQHDPSPELSHCGYSSCVVVSMEPPPPYRPPWQPLPAIVRAGQYVLPGFARRALHLGVWHSRAHSRIVKRLKADLARQQRSASGVTTRSTSRYPRRPRDSIDFDEAPFRASPSGRPPSGSMPYGRRFRRRR